MELSFSTATEEAARGDGHLEMLAAETEDDAEDEVVETISIVAEDDGGVKHLFAKLSVFNTTLEDAEVSFSPEEDASEEFDAVKNEVDNVVLEEVWSSGPDNTDVVEGTGDNPHSAEAGLPVVSEADTDGTTEVGAGLVFWDTTTGRAEIVFVEIPLEVAVVTT